jgi:hypothetical protein
VGHDGELQSAGFHVPTPIVPVPGAGRGDVIGISGGASTWASSGGWTQLKVSFTTGSSGTVTVYVHGWYGQGDVYADDFSVT